MMKEYGNIDLHMHTTVSDGTDSPEQIYKKVVESGIVAFSVTDHDAVKANAEIRALARPGGPIFIPGVEFSCRDENGKYHILGYGADPDAPDFAGVLKRGHDLRMEKVRARLDFIKTEFGFSFPIEETETLLSLYNPGKPHIGNLMVKYGYADTKEDAIEKYLNRLKLKSHYVRPGEAISGILAGGGIPVLAHPFYGSGDELILGDEMETRLRRLMAIGLRGIEVFYSGFTDKLRSDALSLARKYDLFVTAGSDYHGSNKFVALGDTGLDSAEIYPRGLIRFLECFRL